MNTVARFATAFAATFAAGAALMYYLDPVTGRRRRALVRDRGVAAGHDAEYFARAKSKRAIDRAQGMVARARAGLSSAPVDDDRLHDHVRAKLGRLVAHPGEVNIDVHDGHVVLRGRATDAEIEDLTEALVTMHGVTGIDNRMSTDASAPRH